MVFLFNGSSNDPGITDSNTPDLSYFPCRLRYAGYL
jgi:hypothetical protein